MIVRRLLFFIAAFILFYFVAPRSSFGQCTQPPTVTITYSWAPKAYVGITINSVPSGPVSTAISNWNAGLLGWHCSPILFPLWTGGPDLSEKTFVHVRTGERISLWHFPGKYREAEGAPPCFLRPGKKIERPINDSLPGSAA
jgi:hypothetical protein